MLEEYKSKRILKKIDLIIRKKIKLLFHISNSIHISNKINQPIDLKDATAAVHNKANYIWQPIDVNYQQQNIFYDTECGDMVSIHSAIKRLSKRVKEEYKEPLTQLHLRGLGWVKTESKFVIYQIKLPLFCGSDAVL